MKYISVAELRDLGILQELNREFLHPLGLAAQVDMSDGSLLIQDHREDPEGAIFADGFMEFAKRHRFEAFRKERQESRERALGFVQQPPAEEEFCYYCAEPLEDGLCSASCPESAGDEGRDVEEE